MDIDTVLEFSHIKQQLCEYALCEYAKEELAQLRPSLSETECLRKMEETTQARRLLDTLGAPPLTVMKGLADIVLLAGKGAMLTAEQLETVASFLTACRRMKLYLQKADMQEGVASYGQSIHALEELREETERTVRGGIIQSEASPALRDIRRRIERENEQIKRKLEELLRSRKAMFSDGYVSIRGGRYVLPVKKEFKNQVAGSVLDISGTGSTYFVEPSAVRKMQDAISALQLEEENEIRKILYTLTALVDEYAGILNINREAMTALDVVFAKAKLSADMRAVPASLNTERRIVIRQGRHPLLKREDCVPLDFTLGGEIRGVVITGPNTGGKTVALKTVGLLSVMAQCGLHVPAQSAELCLNSAYLCDIGDGQSISENLSTFSAHICHIIRILEQVNEESLVLLDELGSGTDPAEGMGIAVAILEELRQRGCLFVATTHYPEVKTYAAETQGLINARMAFDRESLRPLYRLEIGEAGESCALYIAQRLGFPARLLARAHEAAYRHPAAPHAADSDWHQDPDTPTEPKTPATAGQRIQKAQPPKAAKAADKTGRTFQIGDSVEVLPDGRLGLVFRTADAEGRVGVQIQKDKMFISHKRLRLKTPASELYPPDYDFSILFDSVETRKARRQMEKRHVPGLSLTLEEPGKKQRKTGTFRD